MYATIPGGDGSTTYQVAAVADSVTDSTAGTAVTTPTTSTFSLSMVDDVMQRVWQNGGKPTTLMMSPRLKRAFSVAAQGTNRLCQGKLLNVRRNIDEKGKLSQSVTLYESDFGLVKVIPNYIMSAGGQGSGSAAASHR